MIRKDEGTLVVKRLSLVNKGDYLLNVNAERKVYLLLPSFKTKKGIKMIPFHSLTQNKAMSYLTRIPAIAPSSGFNIHKSLSPGPAASTIPSDIPKRILRGAKLATITVCLPIKSSGL